MTVDELIMALSQVPGRAEVVFSPKDWCASGWPEWIECRIREEFDYDESQIPTGRVMIELDGETE